MKTKPWYESKIIGIALVTALGSLSDGLLNGWTWRQFVVAGIGVALVVVRAFYTDSTVNSGVMKPGGDADRRAP